MVHLRIVAPPDLTDTVVDALTRWSTVTNVITLPGAACKPDGDVVLCDVAREQTSVILEELVRMGVTARGSVAVDHLDTVISRGAQEAEREAPGAPADAVIWEDVTSRTAESVTLSGVYVLFMALAAMIASVGLFYDSAILVVGAMVVGPEFGPLAGVCVAAIRRRPRLAADSFVALAVGFVLAIGLTALTTLGFRGLDVIPDGFDAGQHLLSDSIANPDVFALFVALCAGVAGMVSLTTAKSGALVGVLVSVTTVPAAANAGVALAYGRMDTFGGSLGQLAVNVAGIIVAGIGTLAVQRALYERRRAAHRAQDGRV